MNFRKIKLDHYENVADFKIQLLHKLNLYNYNKDCVSDFYERIENYLKRNSQVEIEIFISKTALFKKIYTKVLGKLTKQDIPKNYPWSASNMETQMYYNSLSGEEYELLRLKAENKSIIEMDFFINEFEKINRFNNLKIRIEE